MNPDVSKIGLAHHWLVTYRGGERVLAEIRRMFPYSSVSTLVCKRGLVPEWIIGKDVITSPLQCFPFVSRFYKALLPLHPWAFARLRVPDDTQLILTSDAAMTKGLRMPDGAKHVCYCHSPPRYLWGMEDEYLANAANVGIVGRAVFRWSVPRAREFDYAAAQRVDRFIANSQFIAKRIARVYNKDATVIYPPVSVEDFSCDQGGGGDFYLLVTQLTPYKRADIAVRAFTVLKKKLIVIGEGSELAALRKIAGPTISIMGHQPFKVVKEHFEHCKAFLYPQVEDFGITAVEAQAAGKPVIAYRAGGALETVVENKTGLFFDEQTPESLIDAVERFEKMPNQWNKKCRENALRFSPERFRDEIKSFLLKHYANILDEYPWPNCF